MSLYESPSFNYSEPSFVKALPVTPPSVGNPIERLSAALDGLLVVRKTDTVQRSTESVVVFTGTLTDKADTLYEPIAERFKAIGYTAMLERLGNEDVVVAVPGLVRVRTFNTPWWVHLLLLLATIVSTIASGAQFGGYPIPGIWREIQAGSWEAVIHVALVGAPFAITLLLILGVHEMGHYVAARLHKVSVTLPYFIPMPVIGILGTLGAVIFIKSALTNRKALFDVGLSGPLAGFFVALPAFVIGLQLPTAIRPYTALRMFDLMFGGGFQGLGMPPLLNVAGHAVVGPFVNLSTMVIQHPVALAAWFGMLLTVLNMLPIGQLDGGHVVYTLFGRTAWLIALATFSVLVFIGLTTFPSFLIYALLALLTGLRHPPPANDITPLDPVRRIIGFGSIVLFFLIATPTPFIVQGGFGF